MNEQARTYQKHYEESLQIAASPETLFKHLDDHNRLSSHMEGSSWMMGGGSMKTSLDEGLGQKVGSHIKLSGEAFGLKIFLDEAVTRREEPFLKIWETVGALRLFVVGHYQMGFEIKPQNSRSLLRIFIDYNMPETNAWTGWLFGGYYAKWCVRQMIKDAHDYFAKQQKGIK